MRRLSTLTAILAAALLATALGVPGAGAQAPTTVDVVLSEWSITPTPQTVTAGSVTFSVKNEGGTKHEMIIVRGDDPKALPKKSNGSLNEAKLPDDAIVGSIEGVKSQKAKRATFELPAGTYLLICNVVDPQGHHHATAGFHGDDEGDDGHGHDGDDEHEHGDHEPSHFKMKMYTVFTVT